MEAHPETDTERPAMDCTAHIMPAPEMELIMPCSYKISAFRLPLLAVALSLGAAAAQATPADDFAAILDAPEFEEWMHYERVTDAPDGGVVVHNWQLTANALVEMRFLTYPDDHAGPVQGPDGGSPVVVTASSVHLDQGMLGMIFGVQGGEMPSSVGFSVEGLAIDLAAMTGAYHIDLLRAYIGGAAMVTGDGNLVVDLGAGGQQDIHLDANLNGVGDFMMDIRLDETPGSLPSGTIVLTETDAHGLTGLGTFLHRIPVEISLLLAEHSVEMAREEPIGEMLADPTMEDPMIALLETQISDARAHLALYPESGAEAAAAVALWAERMADSLPDHAALFDAIGDFADTAGTLTLTLNPPADGASLFDAAPSVDFYNDAALVAGAIDALGLTARFEAAK